MVLKPVFPIKVVFIEDGEELIFDNEDDLACTLEWFDSEDPEERANVTDKEGRAVRLKVTGLEVITCELAP